MDRLTYRNENGKAARLPMTHASQILEKLAAYEDTGMRPEEIPTREIVRLSNYDELIETLRKMHDVSIGLAAIMPQSGGDVTAKLYNDAADAIETLQKELYRLGERHPEYPMEPAPEWISVEDRLPEDGTRNLVTRYDFVTNTPFYDLLWLDNGEWWNRQYAGDYAVTHWMPLPEPPKGGT